MKLLNQNLLENQQERSSFSSKRRKSAAKSKRGSGSVLPTEGIGNIIASPLDWETDEVTLSLAESSSNRSFDVVIACDCIYNDSLIAPLVQTCMDACKLGSSASLDEERPTICIVAQQLRSDEVFESWLKAFHKSFRVWRVPDAELIEGLRSGSGFVVHIGILRQIE